LPYNGRLENTMVYILYKSPEDLERRYIKIFKDSVRKLSMICGTDLGKFIDELTRVSRIGYYSYIAKELGIKERMVYSYIRKLQRNNFKFTVNINIKKIGLYKYFIHIPEMIDFDVVRNNETIAWLNNYSITLNPIGTSLTYFVPYKLKDELISKINRFIIDKHDRAHRGTFVHFYINTRYQPTFHKAPFGSHKFIHGFLFNEIVEMFENSELDDIVFKHIVDEINSKFSSPYDAVDLIILKEYDIDAFTTVQDISKKYPISQRIILKHLNNHINNKKIIRGIFLKTNIYSSFLFKFLGVFLFVYDLGNAVRVFNFFKNFDYSLSINLGIPDEVMRDQNYEFVISVQVAVPQLRVYEFLKFLDYLYRRGYVVNYKLYEFLPGTFVRFTIPYLNFDQERKDWTLDVKNVQELLMRRFMIPRV